MRRGVASHSFAVDVGHDRFTPRWRSESARSAISEGIESRAISTPRAHLGGFEIRRVPSCRRGLQSRGKLALPPALELGRGPGAFACCGKAANSRPAAARHPARVESSRIRYRTRQSPPISPNMARRAPGWSRGRAGRLRLFLIFYYLRRQARKTHRISHGRRQVQERAKTRTFTPARGQGERHRAKLPQGQSCRSPCPGEWSTLSLEKSRGGTLMSVFTPSPDRVTPRLPPISAPN